MREWILSWRVNPARDMRVLPDTAAVELDPSGHPPEEIPVEDLGSKAIIDATRRWKYPPLSLPSRKHLEAVAKRWPEYGLPALGALAAHPRCHGPRRRPIQHSMHERYYALIPKRTFGGYWIARVESL
jgi:3-polyprenyl-4-hydroxybenzoate decarboxylase